jgi:hypothetical protein
MTVSTQVIWATPVPQETIDAIDARADELIADGKEIGTPVRVQDFQTNQVTFTRTWIDEPTAVAWVAFVESYGPVSATVLN